MVKVTITLAIVVAGVFIYWLSTPTGSGHVGHRTGQATTLSAYFASLTEDGSDGCYIIVMKDRNVSLDKLPSCDVR